MPKRFSTARGREFGDAVRAALSATGMTAREICEKIDWDPGKLSDLMNGKGGCSEVDLAVLLGFCRTPPEEREHILEVFRQTDEKDWWQRHGTTQPILPRTFLEHLFKAKEFVSWCPLVVPGLVQLPDYMRAVCLASASFPQDAIDQAVVARTAMQEVFRQRLACTFLIHEAVLLAPVGGADTMRAQLHHLLQMSVRPYIDIRMVPLSVGAHPGAAGTFELMRFDRIEPVVFLDTEKANLIVERKDSVKGYEKVVEALDRLALDAEESRRRISELAI
ncbi:Helix-turn-helix domain-containing protein [Lentzea albidocapillata subsp. violacea]|uniref:Helix-turn-helix domain-containing protein n=1 Tax=Lentzea albidocapillata subsp. violacea TaxID=128104 RepID=A0A1G8XA53_9PSEU|nr:helix-turn-helix transcriptional regulator [Lentzea albidocapillata]SDJ87351.1 Helix-turn-helix domain-containing protein [Lentzea albidocapillata subsp. violacea]